MSIFNLDFSKPYSYISEYLKSNDDRILLLEPLSVILKLSIMSFKAAHTKIAISNNQVVLQKPAFYQGFIRYLNGDGREDICFLLKPIIRSLELYEPNKSEQSEELSYIYQRAILGLTKLRESYDDIPSTVCHSIDLYISILESHLDGHDIEVRSYVNNKQDPELNLSTSSRINIEQIFAGIWTDSDIRLLYSMFKSAEDDSEVSSSYIKSIENLIKSKKNVIRNRIEKTKKLI